MKVYGMTVFAPSWWAIESKTSHRQVRAIVAATSKRAAFDLFDAAGIHDSKSWFMRNAQATGNAREIEVATAKPGVVFHQIRDMGIDYIEAPLRETR